MFWPVFGQAAEDFFATTIISLFDEKSFNQFYIRLCVQVLNMLFCLLFKLLFKYILFYTFKNSSTVNIEVYVDVTANDGRLKHPKWLWRPFKTVKFQIHDDRPLWKYYEYWKFILTDFSPRDVWYILP